MTTKYTLAWCTTTAAIVTTIMNKKQSVCFSFLRKKNEIIPKEKIEEKKLKITTRFQYLFLSDEEEYFSAMTAHKKHWKLCTYFAASAGLFQSLMTRPSQKKKHNTPKHTQITPIMYTHTV